MFPLISKPIFPLLLLIHLILVCSFAGVPVEKSKAAPTAQQKRLQKKKERLHQRALSIGAIQYQKQTTKKN